MNNKKILIFSIICSLVVLIMVPFVSADSSLITSYPIGSTDFAKEITQTDPSAVAKESAFQETFQLTSATYPTSVNVYATIKGPNLAYGQPSGQFKARIENATAFNSNPTGNVLVTSTNSHSYSEMTNASWNVLTFTFAGDVQLASGFYSLIFYGVNCNNLIEGYQSIVIGGDVSSPSYAGYHDSFVNSAWGTPSTVVDLTFELYGSATEVTPTPTPTATPSFTHGIWNGTHWVNDDNIVEETTDLVLPLLIPLIVIIICAGLGAYFVGLWGFVLGLDVAVVLLYVALPTYMPLWGVLIVAVGNVIVLLMGRR